MFNYECSRRNGEVVGACMDGFLFGACCQLPPKNSQISTIQANSASSTENLLNLHDIDHVPDIPILLNPDGSPVGMSSIDSLGTTKIDNYDSSSYYSNAGGSYTKISTFSPDSSSQRPSTAESYNHDTMDNAGRPQVDYSHLESDFPALLGQQEVLDDLRLPGLIAHSDSTNDIQDHQETAAVNPVTTLLSPDQILQIADPVDQLPALFAQGLGQNNHSGADTILLNENGTPLNEKNNPDELFKPSTGSSNNTNEIRPQNSSQNQLTLSNFNQTSQNSPLSENSHDNNKISSQVAPIIQQYANMHRLTLTTAGGHYSSSTFAPVEQRTPSKKTQSSQKATTMLKIDVTTPMSFTNDDEDLVRVPTITSDVQSGNKKHDELDREEIAINHIISILNSTTPRSATRVTQQLANSGSTIDSWVSIDETSKPSGTWTSGFRPSTTTEFPYTFYKPGGRPSTYYHYDTATQTIGGSSSYSPSSTFSGSSNSYTSRKPGVTSSSYGSSNGYDYSTRPSSNPPAPTVIVLGPLGTEYTTITTQKPVERKPTTGPIRPSLVTKLPSVGTTITHNISTVISTNSAATSNNHVVSTSYISVNLKDNTSPKPVGALVAESVEAESDSIKEPVVTKRPSTVWTTLSTWSGKPSFHLKPSQSGVIFPEEPAQKPIHTVVFKETTVTDKPATTAAVNASVSSTPTATVCDEESPAPNELIDFPPSRNPALNQQEKPTLTQLANDTSILPDLEILYENEIPTPDFVEDDVLTNKVEVFVNKIVESLEGNFQDLKDVVYNKKNITVPATPTKKPPTKKPTRLSTPKPVVTTTKKPGTKKKPTQKPASTDKPAVRPTKFTTSKPKPTSAANPTTKRPLPTKAKPKPTKKTTVSSTTLTTTTITEAVVDEEPEAALVESTEDSAEDTTPNHRKGILNYKS